MALACVFLMSVLVVDLAGKFKELQTLVVVLSLIGKACVNAAWGIGYLMCSELYPTVMR